ncbi:MAG: septum formation initiator family protein [Candidatus Mariimomonas ferrooxydans]
MRNKRRKDVEVKKKRKRTVLFTLGILVIVYLVLTIISGENGLFRYINLISVKEEFQTDIEGLKKQNAETKRQIEALKKDPNLVEELARKQGLTRKDELIFKFEDGQ